MRTRLWIALFAVLVVLTLISLAVGKVWLPLEGWFDRADPRWPIIIELRTPRTLLAIMVGGALAMCGAAMQGYTRNPLADPGVLGVSSMAALGAVMTLYFGLTAGATWILPIAAIIGAIAGVLLLLALSGVTASVITFVLAGVIIQSMAGAGVALALNLAPNPWAVQEIFDWLMGALTDRSMEEVRLAAPFVFVGCAILLTLRPAFEALSLGEASAASLGIDLKRTQILLALGVGLATGACVAVTGIIGFVGLIAPHLMRPLVAASPGRLLLPSALAGAILVLAADIVVRLTPAAAEVKLGVALSALGGPFFLALLIAMRRRIA
ncbi:MAG: FecCD family ABC transporter permease [Hyphomonadaceae bacterium]